MTATPRPWTIKKIVNRTHPTADVWIDDANGKPVLLVDGERAALIVRAVNSHDAMIEALREIANTSISDPRNVEGAAIFMQSVASETLSAIKLAKGET